LLHSPQHQGTLGTLSVASLQCSEDGDIQRHGGGSGALTDQVQHPVFAQLELASGRLTWVSAGHPPPLLVRGAHVVKRLEVPPATPLGMGFERGDVVVGSEQLEPGDVVLIFTDGPTEARQPGGAFLSEEGLTDFLRREATGRAADTGNASAVPTNAARRRRRRPPRRRIRGTHPLARSCRAAATP
jgi:hypothetical protein